MAGLISEEGSLFKVTFPFAGERYEVHSLQSEGEAGLVGMALAVRAAEELQQALDAAVPSRQGKPSFRLATTAPAGAAGPPPTSFPQLVEQLQACVGWLNQRDRDQEEGGPKPVCGLLAGAAILGCPCAAYCLAVLNPGAASLEWPWEGAGTAAHQAAVAGQADALRALLAAAPGAAAIRSHDYHDRQFLPYNDWSVMHSAADGGSLEVVQVLLQAAPESAGAVTDSGHTPLHQAAWAGHVEVVRGLLQAAPGCMLVADEAGMLPLHWGAGHAEVVRLLLAAAPETAPALTSRGETALHMAAYDGAPASVRVLLEAAPQAAGMSDAQGRTPLQHGFDHYDEWFQDAEHLEALQVLVAAMPSPATLAAIAERGPLATPLFADFIKAAPPLTAEQWALVPAPCPGLGRALPAALAHSHEQAQELVRRLPAADATRLRTFALALARLQDRLHVAVPGDVAQRLLCLCLAE